LSVLQSRLERFQGDYLFPKGDEDFNQPTYQSNFFHWSALKRIGLKFRIYDLRHTFATRALESGIDLLTLASMLGHSSLSEVMRYAHPSEARKADAIASMQKKAKAV
jgi:integrase